MNILQTYIVKNPMINMKCGLSEYTNVFLNQNSNPRVLSTQVSQEEYCAFVRSLTQPT